VLHDKKTFCSRQIANIYVQQPTKICLQQISRLSHCCSAPYPAEAPEGERCMRSLAVAALLVVLTGATAAAEAQSPARAEPVDALIVLAADVSRSIDDGEFQLQRKGYAAAVIDPRVLRAIAAGPHHGIAITFVEWAGPDEQHVVVDWTVVRDEEAADGIAATMRSAPRSFVGRTAIGAAIDYGMRRLAAAPATARRRIIDISGDGNSNSGRPVTEARDAAVTAGATINGLAIINNSAGPGYSFHTHPPGGLPKYYRDNVIGGPGSFLLQVEDFKTFSEAMSRKLVAEIATGGGARRTAWANDTSRQH
jgi:hypothetical protein